jgi:hypothetical protein
VILNRRKGEKRRNGGTPPALGHFTLTSHHRGLEFFLSQLLFECF